MKRRTFLRGLGTALALPWLDAMREARAQTSAPKRLLVYYVPNGIYMPAWTPAEVGADYALSPSLASLAPVKDDVTVISGLANRPGVPDGPGDHAAGTGSFLTCAHVLKTEGANIQNGISMDQVAARAMVGQTPFPSLQLGVEGGGSTGDCDFGYSCAYARNISWAGPATPLAKDVSPKSVFRRLFQGRDPEANRAAQEKQRRYRLSVLDFVKEDARKLQAKLGKTDQQKLDEYMTGLRELEQRVESLDLQPTCATEPPVDSESFQARSLAMNDLIVTAFRCDLTRVVSFMLANALTNRVYDFLGVSDGHHQISHHQGRSENTDRLVTIDTWEVSQFADLLRRMKAIPEGEGTLLDNTMALFSSELEDGDQHGHTNLPVLLAGKGGGALVSGRHLRLTQERPLAELYISMLRIMGLQIENFGDDGRGPLQALV